MSAAVHIDLTELVASPIRTGIQRVERELIQHWPAGAPLVPVVASHGGFAPISDAALAACLEGRRPRLLAPAQCIAGPDLRLLNPELFADTARAGCYHALFAAGTAAVGWIVYDFLPWLRPQDFLPDAARHNMPYLRTLAEVPNVAHISAQTRADYEQRIMRGHGRPGPVISLGHDGLALERQHFRPDRHSYVTIGTIERRKNLAAVLEAFAGLWEQGCPAELVVIGRLLDGCEREVAWLEKLRGDKRLRYLGPADDATLCQTLAGARALVTASVAEGFGLTPVEALHVGIPAIVWPHIPSLEQASPAGQIRLAAPTAEAIAAAVRQMEDDSFAANLWAEAETFPPRLWRDFVAEVADWMQSLPLPQPGN